MYPDDAFYDEDDFEPTESDLLAIEEGDPEYGMTFIYDDPFDIDWDYEPYDWSDVISEHDYEDSE